MNQSEKTTEQSHWIDAQESGEYDTVYKCPKCGAKRSVQAEDTATVLGCYCGFMGLLRNTAPVEVEPVAMFSPLMKPKFVWMKGAEPKVCTHLYTSPPDTEAKLKIAVEALNKLDDFNNEQLESSVYVEKTIEQALKDIGEIK